MRSLLVVSGFVSVLALVSALSGCIAPSVLDPGQRAVTEPLEPATLAWRAAAKNELPGFYASQEVRGDAAGALLQAYYYFGPGGSYSGAALVVTEDGPRFVVITEDGQWKPGRPGLDLDDGSGPVRAEVAGGLLRLTSEGSTIVFDKVPLQ